MARTAADDEFEGQTLAFMKNYAVYPQDFKTPPPAVFDKSTNTTRTDDLLTVQRREMQIAYTKLQPIAYGVGGNRKNAYQLFFQTKAQVGGGAGDHVPVWFLPWASNRLVSLKIPPKIPPKPGAVAKHNDPRDPDIFFTAAINGCSVIVHGDPKTPTISHGGTTDPRSRDFKRDDHFEHGSARMHWSNLHKKHYGDAAGAKGIHTGDYRNTMGLDNTPEAFEHRKFLDDKSGKTLRIDDVVAQGCVFGLRDGAGDWSFYLQKNIEVTVTRLRKKGLLQKSYVPAQRSIGKQVKWEGDKKTEVEQFITDTVQISIPINVVKFFPGGMAADKAHAMLDPNQVKMIVESAMG